ncbi:AB hydrolase superfamily protein [Bacillus subtilis]|nr:AB hydrolase superfamily protein [Bacillus subtilis]
MPLISIDSRKHLFYEEYGQGIPIIFIHPPGMGRKVFIISAFYPNISG